MAEVIARRCKRDAGIDDAAVRRDQSATEAKTTREFVPSEVAVRLYSSVPDELSTTKPESSTCPAGLTRVPQIKDVAESMAWSQTTRKFEPSKVMPGHVSALWPVPMAIAAVSSTDPAGVTRAP